MDWKPVEIFYAERDAFVPMEQWGKDHWTTLLYLETRCVDHGGVIRNENMRCDARLHRPLAHTTFGALVDGSRYKTRLQDGEQVEGRHDDWSCIEDMIAAGLVRAWARTDEGKREESVFGYMEARVELTEQGWATAAKLRRWRAKGNGTAAFRTDAEPATS